MSLCNYRNKTRLVKLKYAMLGTSRISWKFEIPNKGNLLSSPNTTGFEHDGAVEYVWYTTCCI